MLPDILDLSEKLINFLKRRNSSQLISAFRLKLLEYLNVTVDPRALKVKGINHIEEIYQVIILMLNFLGETKYKVIIETAIKIHIIISLFIHRGRNTSLLVESIFQERFIPPIIDQGSKNAIPRNIKISLSFILYVGSASKTLLPTKYVKRQE